MCKICLTYIKDMQKHYVLKHPLLNWKNNVYVEKAKEVKKGNKPRTHRGSLGTQSFAGEDKNKDECKPVKVDNHASLPQQQIIIDSRCRDYIDYLRLGMSLNITEKEADNILDTMKDLINGIINIPVPREGLSKGNQYCTPLKKESSSGKQDEHSDYCKEIRIKKR